VHNALGLDAIDQRTIRVHSLGTAPLVRLTASSTHVTAGDRVDLSSAGSVDADGGPLYVHWDFGEPDLGARNQSAQAATSHAFPAPGEYAVTLADHTRLTARVRDIGSTRTPGASRALSETRRV
jgi:hypothetical protein